MSKRRRLTRSMRAAILADQSRREANPRPITLAGQKIKPIMSKDKQRHIITQVIDMMRPWRLTPFENEGAIRHGIRSSLCLQGYEWHRSDAEASAIIAAALKIIGIPRPTWEQGQREYVEPAENCRRCGVSLPESHLRDSQIFCSDICAKAAFTQWNFESRWYQDKVALKAYRASILREKSPLQSCKQCGVGFRPIAGRVQTYCSLSCSDAAQRKYLDQPCAGCGKVFRPRSSKSVSGIALYCSTACYRTFGPVKSFQKICVICGNEFIARSSRANTCGKTCRHMHTSGWIPKRISPPVLDYLFRQQGLRITGERMAA